MMQTQCQFFLTTSEVFAQFAKVGSLEDLANGAVPGASSVDDASPTSPSNQSENSYSKALESPQGLSNKSVELKSGHSVDSPSRLRKHISSFFTKKLGGSKSGSGSNEVPQSSFYVQTPENNLNMEAGTSDSATNSVSKLKEQEFSETAGQTSSDLVVGAGPQHAGVVGEPAGAGSYTTNLTSAGELGANGEYLILIAIFCFH